MIDESLLSRAEANDQAALLELDRQGLPAAPEETLTDYIKRIRQLQERIIAMQEAFAANGEYECEGLKMRAEDQVPVDLLRESTASTLENYDFQIDWVPAFFINPSFSWLFGGCAYYFYPETFALMIIRRSFARKRRWFIYDRDEILAHEMCHVARLAFFSRAYEERFAYAISASGFRRRFGGVFESPADSCLLLGSTFVLLGGQISQTLWFPGLAMWPFWALVGGAAAFLMGRDRQRRRTLKRAQGNLQNLSLSRKQAMSVLFRCADDEIAVIAAFREADELCHWLRQKVQLEIRWRVTAARFMFTLNMF